MASYDIVNNYMMKIINNDWGSGKLILLGGIIINTPDET